MLCCLLILAVLAAPVPVREPVQPLAVLPLLQDLAVDLELMDPSERSRLLACDREFTTDFDLLWKRWLSLRDAPPLHDCRRLPTEDMIQQMIDFNRAHLAWLRAQQELQPRRYWEIQDAVVETEQAYAVWDLMRDARRECYYLTVRRRTLQTLREQLGYEAYYSGQYPPPVPLWRCLPVP